MRVYNLHGRRDNKYKARIKILVHETGAEELSRQVEVEFAALKDTELKLPETDIRRSPPISRRRLSKIAPKAGRASHAGRRLIPSLRAGCSRTCSRTSTLTTAW